MFSYFKFAVFSSAFLGGNFRLGKIRFLKYPILQNNLPSTHKFGQAQRCGPCESHRHPPLLYRTEHDPPHFVRFRAESHAVKFGVFFVFWEVLGYWGLVLMFFYGDFVSEKNVPKFYRRSNLLTRSNFVLLHTSEALYECTWVLGCCGLRWEYRRHATYI